ncbi:MAG: hypothetical protein A3I05_01255 [Deltaproteobacteria bacterium RIFCSPLOWO2_02_FULL_44_10]|nr:MAG: hypothetical protein A3C46_00795 [Deltaproteobacteria bacterium RIFCSPHIGHO2_02_FULL_44_16]OGQ46945.1 MAG: hypothetical protein A3I05_01255 [Deltaproteobacteria bacterium RIFCSPLOWO2_02_FULL_44_10]
MRKKRGKKRFMKRPFYMPFFFLAKNFLEMFFKERCQIEEFLQKLTVMIEELLVTALFSNYNAESF